MTDIIPTKEIQKMVDLSTHADMVVVKISTYEAALLRVLRQYPYGTFIVEKKKGQPRYVKPQGSEVLDEAQGLAFAAETLDDNLGGSIDGINL